MPTITDGKILYGWEALGLKPTWRDPHVRLEPKEKQSFQGLRRVGTYTSMFPQARGSF